MKFKVFLLFFILCFVNNSNAQIQNTEVLFYVLKGASPNNPNISVYIMKWKDGVLYKPSGKYWVDDLGDVSRYLRKDTYFYENMEWVRMDAERKFYNVEMSNSKWDVYERHFNRWVFCGNEMYPEHSRFFAFKKDLSEYMHWREPDYELHGRETLKRLTKTDILNVNINHRDFLD